VRRLFFSIIWLIPALSFAGEGAPLAVQAKSAIILDAATRAVLWEKDADALRYPASTTKIVTALVAFDHTKPEDRIKAPEDTETITGSSLHLRPGESLSAEEMLWSAMLRSANDACHAIAVHIAGSEQAFVVLMNEKAARLGAKNTHFCNPHGLPNRAHVTTARDLALIAASAMEIPEFQAMVKARRRQLASRSMNQEDTFLISRNQFLDWDPTYDGVKTGYTNEARSCYVGSATRGGRRIITVVLCSEDWKTDQKQMMDWAFSRTERKTIAEKGGEAGAIPIQNGVDGSVLGAFEEDVLYAGLKSRQSPSFDVVDADVKAPIRVGQRIATARFRDGKGWTKDVPILATESVDERPSVAGLGNPIGIAILAALGGGAILMRRKTRSAADRYLKAR